MVDQNQKPYKRDKKRLNKKFAICLWQDMKELHTHSFTLYNQSNKY